MTPTTDLSPAANSATAIAESVVAVEPQQPGSLSPSLYALATDLMQLLSLREEMAEAKEDTAEVERTIAAYIQEHLPQKVDAVVHVVRTFESQVELASAEIQRLNARRRQIASAIERLKSYCCSVLELLPKPKRGTRKLEGATSTLILKTNGGAQSLDVYDESLIPDEYCTATVTMPFHFWTSLLNETPHLDDPSVSFKRVVNDSAVRKALATDCWACSGFGHISQETESGAGVEQYECPSCGGSGKNGVPGARLQERGAHLEIK